MILFIYIHHTASLTMAQTPLDRLKVETGYDIAGRMYNTRITQEVSNW